MGLTKKGDRYGRLVVIKVFPWSKKNRRIKCRCDCGTIKMFRYNNLISKNSKSCGLNKCNGRYHHGQHLTTEYSIWESMIQRCNNPKNTNFKNYGGRGIKICKTWFKFKNFFKDMGKRPKGKTLDRINNDRNYTPNNCKWSTYVEQANNKRKMPYAPRPWKRTLFITFRGQKKHIDEWSKETGIKRETLRARMSCGWSVKKTLTTQIGKNI